MDTGLFVIPYDPKNEKRGIKLFRASLVIYLIACRAVHPLPLLRLLHFGYHMGMRVKHYSSGL